jgi:hypothetical protein
VNQQEQFEYEKIIKQVEQEQLRRIDAENKISQMSGFNSGKEPNIIEYQLDVSPTLDRIYHLLSGHIVIKDIKGERWEEPKDDRLKILSDYGVKQIMNLLSFYINPNTLLSNFDEDQIYWKTRDFGIELADLIFNRYEDFFFYPSPEELYETYYPIVKSKQFNINDQELYFKCVQWSRDELQMKFRHYPILVQVLVDTVHATLLRALNGEERESLRKQYNIHQNLNGPQLQDYAPQKTGFFKRLTSN